MSRLILEGNLQQNFGDYYPVPYIDKVYINSSGDQEIELRIHYSLMFSVPQSSKDGVRRHMNKVKSSLENFNFYILLGRSPTYAAKQAFEIDRLKKTEEIKSFGIPLSDLSSLQNPFNILEILNFNSAYLINIIKKHNKDSQSKFIDIDESVLLKKISKGMYVDFTTDGTNRIVKVNHVVKEKIPVMAPPIRGFQRVGAATDLCLVAFSSLYDIEFLKKSKRLSTARAHSLYFGDIAYERLLVSDGNHNSPTFKVPNQIQTFFFDEAGEMFDGMPMQSLAGEYHSPPSGFRDDVIKNFNSLVDSYIPQLENSTDGSLADSIASVRMAIMEDNDISALIPQISKSRMLIPERSTGTVTGQFYEDIGFLLSRSNGILRRGQRVQKQLVANSKIIDTRQRDNDYELPRPKTVESQRVKSKDLFKNFFMDRKIVTTDQPSTRISFADFDVAAGTRFESYIDGLGADEMESFDDDDDLMLQLPDGTIYSWDDPDADGLLNDNYFANEEFNVTFGYFFFDYDTAIRKNSYIANIFNVDRIIKYFGMPWLQGFFQPIEVRLSKFEPQPKEPKREPKKPIMTFTTPLSFVSSKNPRETEEYNPGGGDPAGHGEIRRHGSSIDDGAPHQKYPEKVALRRGRGEDESIVINSYLAQRSFNMVNEDLLRGPEVSLKNIYGSMIDDGYVSNSYRLMAFEFQNIDQMATLDDYEDKVYDKYTTAITIEDGTRQAVLHIINNFFRNMENFRKEYVLLAQQFCSYNNLENTFNDFFKSAMQQRYSDDPASAPWVYGVAMYVRHMEFLTDKYGGSDADQLVDAKELLQRIQPETGTLEQVEAFMNVLEETYENFYGPSSQIGKYLIREGSELDGDGAKAYAPVSFTLKYSTKHESFVRSAFLVDERNEFLSLINDERDRYLDAEQAYDMAVFRSELPQPEEKILDPSLPAGGCQFTVPECGNPFSAIAKPNATKCSGKVYNTGAAACICPEGTYEDDAGICQEIVDVGTLPLFTVTIEDTDMTNVSTLTDEQIKYEANKMKKRTPQNGKNAKKDKHDCQYLKWRKSKNQYWWKSPKNANNWECKYDKAKHGSPSYYAYVKRRIKKTGSGKNKKIKCQYKSFDGWKNDPTSLSKLKDKIKKHGRIGDTGNKFKFLGDT